MISAIFGLVGVLLGGMVSFGIQWHFQSKADQKELRSNLRALQFHIMDAVNDVGRLNRHFDHNIPPDFDGQYWTVLQRLSNFHSGIIELDKHLLAPLCDGQSDDFLNDLLDFISFRNSLVVLVQTYNHDRKLLSEATAPFTQARVGVLEAPIAFAPNEHPELVIMINEIDALAQDLIELAREARPLSANIANSFPAVSSRIGGKDFKVRFEMEQ